VVEPFATEFPERFLNAGVAEQNMTGVAAGLASEGWAVFTYSIANFPTLRCFEQIRNDVAYHRLPVAVVAVGGGMAYGNLGYSHHAVQDLAVMRTLPGFTVFAPADPGETKACVTSLAKNPRPAYLRIGKAGEPELHQVSGIECGPLQIRTGIGDVAIVSTGGMLKTALDTYELLKAQGLAVSVFSMPQLKPIFEGFLAPLHQYNRIFALEEHVAEGGLASVLRENLPPLIEVVSLHVPERTATYVGSQQYLREKTGLSAQQVSGRIRS
jgi:transketolase